MSSINTKFSSFLSKQRRRSGLSQFELADLAGLSQKHVSFLETGRSKPGREVVLRICDALDLSLLQSDILLNSAGYSQIKSPFENGASLVSALNAVRKIMQQQNPYPAVLVDTAQNILETNLGFDCLMAEVSDEELINRTCPEKPNLLRIFLHEDGLFHLIVDPGLLIPSLIRRVVHEARGDPEALALVDEILAWPNIRRLSIDGRIPKEGPAVYSEQFRFGDRDLSLICLVTSIGAPGSAEAERLRLEMFHPADKISDDIIHSTFSNVG